MSDHLSEDETAASMDLYTLFQQPPSRYRPMVRWWWNGDRVEDSEILRELDLLEAVGVGGFKINPIKFPSEEDPMNTTALVWLSDAWMDRLAVALQGAKDRNLTCDMIVGSGWPFGGEFLSRADQMQMVALGSRTLSEPAHLKLTKSELIQEVTPAFVSPYKNPLKQLVGLSLVPYKLHSEHDQIALTHQLEGDEIVVDVPSGQHVLYFLVKLTGFMAVINGAPGAAGPVLNHYDAGAVERYLDRLSGRLTAKLGPLNQYLRAFFTDSIELEGANWCDDMPRSFSVGAATIFLLGSRSFCSKWARWETLSLESMVQSFLRNSGSASNGCGMTLKRSRGSCLGSASCTPSLPGVSASVFNRACRHTARNVT